MGQLRQTEMELNTLQKELTAHKYGFVILCYYLQICIILIVDLYVSDLFRHIRSALYRMETEGQQEAQNLRAELEKTVRHLQAYEALEVEIDGAVVRTAGLHGRSGGGDGDGDGDGEDAAAHGGVQEATNKLLQSVKGIPSNPERRIKQAVQLAHRLLEAERQRDVLRAQLTQAQADLAASAKKVAAAEENLTRAAQPTAYLVCRLRDEETAKLACLSKCRGLEAELQKTRKSAADSQREVAQLRERLGCLLQQRGELETVKVMLAQLSALECASEDEEEDEEEEDGGRGGSRYDDRLNTSGMQEEKKDVFFESRGLGGGLSRPYAAPPAPAPAPSSPPARAGAGSRTTRETCEALGLSPAQLEEFTSPPKSSEPGSRTVVHFSSNSRR
jgi:hypothetical protein